MTTYRKLDKIGRITIPKEFREKLELFRGDFFEVFEKDGDIIFRKSTDRCIFCKTSINVFNVLGKPVCKVCRGEIRGDFDSA